MDERRLRLDEWGYGQFQNLMPLATASLSFFVVIFLL